MFHRRFYLQPNLQHMAKLLTYLYWIIAAIEVYGEATDNDVIRFCSKPLLMIVLILLYARSIGGPANAFHKLMVAAFFFSWIGDVALMFVPRFAEDLTLMGFTKDPNFFLVGLVGFLIAHLLYVGAFARVTDKTAEALLPKKWWVLVPLIIYMGVLLSLLVPAINAKPETQPFLIPVLVYSTVIATMTLFAINRYRRVNDQSFALVFGGALLFMFSDSIIAINKFVAPFELARVAIMVLYITAQYLIARGALNQEH